MESELKKVGVPKPVSFAYSGNFFGPEAREIVRQNGYKLARRGESPEAEYGTLQVGPTFDPRRHDPLLIPTTGDAYPNWSLEHFTQVVSHAKTGQAVVLQFHGVPDVKHPWVHTPPPNFQQYMSYLKDHGYRVIPLRELAQYINTATPPADPMVKARHRQRDEASLCFLSR